jgi:hypothetical protein
MSVALYCVFGYVLSMYCISRFCLNVTNCPVACFIFFLASVECIYSVLVFCVGSDKLVSQNWHYFGSVMKHYSKQMISVDYHCCTK